MSDIFISYARSTAPQAETVAKALRELGYGVWRDDELPAHRSYAQVIEERLTAAEAVVVLWSADARQSEWVQSEADHARNAHKLVQLNLDGSPLPMPFDRIQCADLSGWQGDLTAPGWRKVLDSIAALAPEGPAQADRHAPKEAREPLLAVLAFDNLSGDPEMTYFSDGVSEEIQQVVARGSDLKVIGRTSSFQLRGASKSVRKAAAELNATHVLDGSVRRSGQRVRVGAQLIACDGEVSLWSERFDGDLGDIFAIQDEIAAAVAAALKKAFARPSARPVLDPATHEAFLRVKDLVLNMEADAKHIAKVDEITRRAPEFAQGWLLAAQLRQILWEGINSGWSAVSDGDAAVMRTEAERALDRAAALTPDDPQLEALRLGFEPPCPDWASHEQWIERALAKSPNDASLISEKVKFLRRVGRYREALPLMQELVEMDPLHALHRHNLALGLITLRRREEGMAILRQNAERWPNVAAPYLNYMMYSARDGDWETVDRGLTAEALARFPADGPNVKSFLGAVAGMRMTGQARIEEYSRRTRTIFEERGRLPFARIGSFARLGDADVVFDYVERSDLEAMRKPGARLEPGDTGGLATMFSAWDATLREDPRFVRICKRVGLVDYWLESDRWPDCADEIEAYDFKAACRQA